MKLASGWKKKFKGNECLSQCNQWPSCAYGNAIVPQVAAQFILAAQEAIGAVKEPRP